MLTQLDGGPELDVTDGVITFAFLNQQHVTGINNNPQLGEGKGYSPFNAAQKVAAREAVNNWDELIAPEFKEITPAKGAKTWAQSGADIWLANTTTGPAQAWAYYPGSGNQYSRISSDVWIADPRVNSTNGQLDPGVYGLQTLNHELGHASAMTTMATASPIPSRTKAMRSIIRTITSIRSCPTSTVTKPGITRSTGT